MLLFGIVSYEPPADYQQGTDGVSFSILDDPSRPLTPVSRLDRPETPTRLVCIQRPHIQAYVRVSPSLFHYDI